MFAVLTIVLFILGGPCLLFCELREGGLPPTTTLKKLLGLRHCQVTCAKNVKTRIDTDSSARFGSRRCFSIAVSPRIVGTNEGHETHVSPEETSRKKSNQTATKRKNERSARPGWKKRRKNEKKTNTSYSPPRKCPNARLRRCTKLLELVSVNTDKLVDPTHEKIETGCKNAKRKGKAMLKGPNLLLSCSRQCHILKL